MHKIDSDGATVGFQFTEGSAVLSIPATIVSAAWLNAIQGELVKMVEAVGLVLLTSSTDTEDQVFAATKILIERGGREAPVTHVLANNAGPVDITGMPTVDSVNEIHIEMRYRFLRRTDSNEVFEYGKIILEYDSEADIWTPLVAADKGDDTDTTFTMVLVAGTEFKLQVTTVDLVGANYAGSLKITDLKRITA